MQVWLWGHCLQVEMRVLTMAIHVIFCHPTALVCRPSVVTRNMESLSLCSETSVGAKIMKIPFYALSHGRKSSESPVSNWLLDFSFSGNSRMYTGDTPSCSDIFTAYMMGRCAAAELMCSWCAVAPPERHRNTPDGQQWSNASESLQPHCSSVNRDHIRTSV